MAVMAVAVSSLMAQETYRYEVGGGVGMSNYLGDANRSNLLKHPGWAAGGIFRYVIDRRLWLASAEILRARYILPGRYMISVRRCMTLGRKLSSIFSISA